MKIIFPKEGEPVSQADPYIIRANGRYYIYATNEEGVTVYTSDRLESGWEFAGFALRQEGHCSFWAPCVIEEGGKFYMYYSALPVGEQDVHCQRIKVAVSDRPDGGFAYVKDVAAPFSIDPHVVKNETGFYMFYSVNDYEAARAGTYIVVDKMKDLFTLEGAPVPSSFPRWTRRSSAVTVSKKDSTGTPSKGRSISEREKIIMSSIRATATKASIISSAMPTQTARKEISERSGLKNSLLPMYTARCSAATRRRKARGTTA